MINYENLSNCWVDINTENILNNKHSFQKHLRKDCKICCVVKADAYGHGASEIAKLFEKDGVDYFGVANILEAISLRDSGIKTPILILGYTNPVNAKMIAKYDLTQAVFSREYAEQLLDNLSNEIIKIHLKVNSGMNRIGFRPQDKESIENILLLAKDNRFNIEGIFTHFYDADSKEKTEKQFKTFVKFVERLKEVGLNFEIKHCCNSAASINYPEMQLDMVRVGASLYGIKVTSEINVKEAMSLKARISQIYEITRGETISYGARFKAKENMKVATVTAGYADGILRSNFDKLYVTVNGVSCKVLGTICMDQLMIDATDVKCAIGDTVVIYGNGGTPIDNVANNNSTIAYEIMCDVGKRVKRIYK